MHTDEKLIKIKSTGQKLEPQMAQMVLSQRAAYSQNSLN